MKPVFSGPSGRKPGRRTPKVGDTVRMPGNHVWEIKHIINGQVGMADTGRVGGKCDWKSDHLGTPAEVEEIMRRGTYQSGSLSVSDNDKWQSPPREALRKVGDKVKVEGGVLELRSFNDDGTANITAISAVDVLTFRARRNDEGEWDENVYVDVNTMPASAEKYMSRPQLGDFDPELFKRVEAQGWAAGFKAASLTENLPLTEIAIMSGATINGHKSAIETHEALLRDNRREAASVQRQLAQLKVKRGAKLGPITDEEYARDVEEVSRRIAGGMKLEKPQGSSLHHLRQYLEDTGGDGLMDSVKSLMMTANYQSMVIEHDWAAAFEGVEGMNDDGEIPMPFDYTCFEFRINGLRILLMMGIVEDNHAQGIMCTGINGRWYVNAEVFEFKDGKFRGKSVGDIKSVSDRDTVEKFIELIARQVRAVCIMLDADVAKTDVQQPGAGLNAQRRRQGRTELKPYHVVRINRQRRRAEPRETPVVPGTRKRAHVRRGHTRHYQSPSSGETQYIDADGILRSKSWINWMLVGDIELGFVDKEYRL